MLARTANLPEANIVDADKHMQRQSLARSVQLSSFDHQSSQQLKQLFGQATIEHVPS